MGCFRRRRVRFCILLLLLLFLYLFIRLRSLHTPELTTPTPTPTTYTHPATPTKSAQQEVEEVLRSFNNSILNSRAPELPSILSHLETLFSRTAAIQNLRYPRLVLSSVQFRLQSPSGRRITRDEVRWTTKDREKTIPSLVHFVLPFYAPQLRFHHFVCVLSAIHVIRPARVMFWYQQLPSGYYWDLLKRNLSLDFDTRIIFAQRPVPWRIYGRPVEGREHQSDVIRLEALLIFGGIYLDLDVLVIRPFDALLSKHKSCILGRETHYGISNAIIIAEPVAPFLLLWHLGYQTLEDRWWSGHSIQLPHLMAKRWPDLLYVEPQRVARPDWTAEGLERIYGRGKGGIWWKDNFCMHLWYRKHGMEYDHHSIRDVDSAFGEMCRWVLFGQVRRFGGNRTSA